jgi:Tfp pilus assembly protein PilV
MISDASQEGFALVEVMVAGIIFVLVTLGLTSSSLNAKRASDGSRFAAEATTLAFDKLEQLRTLAPAATDLTAGAHADGANPMPTSGSGRGIYSRSWTVTATLPSLAPAVTSVTIGRIDVRVSWPSPAGSGTVTLTSYFKLS